MITSIKSNKIILSLLFIIIYSCTKVIDIEENLPMIDSIVMDSHILEDNYQSWFIEHFRKI